jgi:hypothetical protein
MINFHLIRDVGFTGSRNGVTPQQRRQLELYVALFPQTIIVHHGDCVGADAAFDEICRNAGLQRTIHPGHNRDGAAPTRAFCGRFVNSRGQAPKTMAPLGFRERDKIIATISDVVFACPDGPERLYSGTWATVRDRRKNRVSRVLRIIFPDGTVREED